MYDKDLEIEDNNPQWIKFVDYFNEFWKEKFGERSPFQYENRFDNVHIISKHMWSIEWLVNHDKVDFWPMEIVFYQKNQYNYDWVAYHFEEYSRYENLIMILSIQENPITFILEILK